MVLGVQHLFAMFGATVPVPTLTGFNSVVAFILIFGLRMKNDRHMDLIFKGRSFLAE